jgi:hypothetical protein
MARHAPCAETVATTMANIVGVLARVFVDDIDAALELYQSHQIQRHLLQSMPAMRAI